ncbi:putative Dol-P-Glc:Glc(2)Man(9)GlcNAc(2)-PP-Dol alpha-1,2-glucosyltransferase [Orussus abietinus]|uniref:putative Dol-P-Glc:Glc(2)Man(9)GlcNAc(2)-PP-Dol alpha-1,2-glucosyltransferase n=1 Tax=Orussus abietinus TaxID=222816 RepID=UPI000625F0E5|nr:putative Dol-P-Glc:Glc(2)Man(9)GlcNAc(2)-PP-Dol alpha-1,2-glucosyltransferase [Orussus abietinus]
MPFAENYGSQQNFARKRRSKTYKDQSVDTCEKTVIDKKFQLPLGTLFFLQFVAITISLFIYLNSIHPYYFIDEAFHIPQTLRYCEGKFFEWDSKITTLPGLYLITAGVLAPFGLCNITWIRSINLIGTLFNVFLVYKITKYNRSGFSHSDWIHLTTTYVIVLFPPLYFWFFLYYTDVISVNTVLLMLLLQLQKHFTAAAFVGMLSIFVRQTNIIWVVLLTVERALQLLETRLKNPISQRILSSPKYVHLLWDYTVDEARRGLTPFFKFVLQMGFHLLPYVTIILGFIAFVIWNGGIVVGDHSAHVPTIHVPQMFYFSIFTLCFAWPYMLPHGKGFFRSIRRHWQLTSLLLVSMITVIHFNTLVHPYVLADNRHYVFYVWNKLMGRYVWFKYVVIPVYGFSMYAFLACIGHVRYLSKIAYIGAVCTVLIPQLLLEPRYFIIPYIIFRLHIQKPKFWQLSLELLATLTVNFLQFFIFANKVFYWPDQPNPQRISW